MMAGQQRALVRGSARERASRSNLRVQVLKREHDLGAVEPRGVLAEALATTGLACAAAVAVAGAGIAKAAMQIASTGVG